MTQETTVGRITFGPAADTRHLALDEQRIMRAALRQSVAIVADAPDLTTSPSPPPGHPCSLCERTQPHYHDGDHIIAGRWPHEGRCADV